ncbi:MAG: hypothetical protein D6800_09015 [Candidatus Zixiibacteriota bacterium]|nr:MAG: hypothetical protein D6800_09015 [candidate division Zixibacteria bacterium]
MSKTRTQFAAVVSANDEYRTILALLLADVTATPRKPIKVVPVIDGVFGTFSIGDSNPDLDDFTLRFSEANQSRLLARCVFFTNVGPNLDYSVFHSGVSWQGIVDVEGSSDIVVRIGERNLGGQMTEALIIGLTDDIETRKKYAAILPRPENHTCGDPAPIETINGVRADCCGRIYIELRGCANPIPLQPSGVAIDCPETVETICPPPKELDPVDRTQHDRCVEDAGEDKPEVTPSEEKPKPPPGYLW